MTKRLNELTDRIQRDSIRSMLKSNQIQEVYVDAALETLAGYIVELEGKIGQHGQSAEADGATNRAKLHF